RAGSPGLAGRGAGLPRSARSPRLLPGTGTRASGSFRCRAPRPAPLPGPGGGARRGTSGSPPRRSFRPRPGGAALLFRPRARASPRERRGRRRPWAGVAFARPPGRAAGRGRPGGTDRTRGSERRAWGMPTSELDQKNSSFPGGLPCAGPPTVKLEEGTDMAPSSIRLRRSRSAAFGALLVVFAAVALVGAARMANPDSRGRDERPEKHLFVWTGDQARQAPDFLAVVDFDASSSRYGKVITTVPLPEPGASGNEPHHVGLSADGNVLACGGLLSVLKGQKEIFFFDV